MSDLLPDVLAFDGGLALWHQLARSGVWAGVAAIVLAGLGALGWVSPPARRSLVALALLVTAAWGGLEYGHRAGRADVTAEWDAANARAAAAAAARDDTIRAALEARHALEAAALRARAADLSNQVDAYAQRLARQPGGNSCRLGDDALRLRRQPR